MGEVAFVDALSHFGLGEPLGYPGCTNVVAKGHRPGVACNAAPRKRCAAFNAASLVLHNPMPPRKGTTYEFDEKFGKVIAGRLEDKGWNKSDLARKIGADRSFIGRIIKGEVRESTYLPEICRVLEIDWDPHKRTITIVQSSDFASGTGVPATTTLTATDDAATATATATTVAAAAAEEEILAAFRRLSAFGKGRALERVKSVLEQEDAQKAEQERNK